MKLSWLRRNTQIEMDALTESSTDHAVEERPANLSRRILGKQLLLGIPAGMVAWAATQPQVAEAGTDGDWALTGNALPDATKFIGTTNAQPLNIKTSNVLRMIVNAAGRVGIGTSAPGARFHVLTGDPIAIRGETASTAASAAGVLGRVSATSPGADAAGVRGHARANTAFGGLFRNDAGAGSRGVAVRGLSASGAAGDIHPAGGYYDAAGEFAGPNGVIGAASTDTSNGYGVLGLSAGTVGSGVYGRATATSGTARGVFGSTASTTGYGVHGSAPNSISSALNAVGVKGEGTVGVQGSGEYMGVQGTSTNYGVFGYTNPDTGGMGVYGRGQIGVKGRSYTGSAVLGDTDSGVGVKGESYSDGGGVKAIFGDAMGANSNGVVGQANNGTAAYGVWGISTSGYAGVFSGKVIVTGALSKGGGSFKIDHPLDPENKYLYHSFVESPDMMNIYNGNVVTDGKGIATVTLPSYFEALNRDFRYQLTVVGQFAQAIVASKVANNRFTIRTDKPMVEVSWQVTGIRKDAWANANRIPEEEVKPASERGKYLHPQAFGKVPTMDVQYERARMAVSAQAQQRQPDPKPTAPRAAPSEQTQ